MGFFPFFAPLYPWAIDEMRRREDNLVSTTFRNPWATLISSALVVKASANDTTETDEQKRIEKIHNIISNPPKNAYFGCIISNNINNLDLSYSPNQSVVGLDFNGKPIEVIGETGRKISTPIIESIDVDTDGANNTLKTAKVTVTCFSLKQLEMFEMFFMKPGMNVMVEWGDNSLLTYNKFMLKGDPSPTSPVTLNNVSNRTGQSYDTDMYKRPEEAMVINQEGNRDYEVFCENFSGYFRSDTDALGKYLNRVKRSRGSYDLVAGKVLDYSFSVNENGTYTATFDVSQGNQMTQFLPKNARKGDTKSTEKTPGIDISDEDTIKRQIAVDFDLNEDVFKQMLKKHPEKNGKWMDDWFNFIKINKEQKDTVASSTAYVSLRFILAILANYGVKSLSSNDIEDDYFFTLRIQKWMVGNEEKYIIPCISSKYMFSSSEEIIYPLSSPPIFEAPAYDKDKKGSRKLKNPNSENKITIKPESEKKDIKIGPYDFHLNVDKLEHPAVNLTGKEKIDIELPKIEVKKGDGFRLGNALNIFLKYETVLKHWRRAYTRKDFIEEILNTCNKNSYGLFRLVYGNMGENGFPIAGPTILDIKFKGTQDPKKDEPIYRFKPTTINSIVKQFSFNFEMSNLVAGRTLFNSSKFLEEAIKAKKEQENSSKSFVGPTQPNTENKKDEQLPLPPNAYKSVDNSTFGNADGFYSINKVELKILQKRLENAQKLDKLGGGVSEKDDQSENTESTTEVEDLKEVIKNRSINFLIDETQKSDKRVMIFKDNSLIQEAISGDPTKKRLPTVSPITITLTIDGFSGFNCGQYFYIDGVPEIYNKLGVFQITNTKHNISKEGWTTTLEADYHVVNKK